MAGPVVAHAAKNLFLVALSLIFLPLDALLLAVSCLLRPSCRPHHPDNTRRTVLVTGLGMSKGLTLARLFHRAGHRVVGADFSPFVCGRFSAAISAFHPIAEPTAYAAPYIASLLHVIQEESVDLWVSCSGVASAVEDGLAKEVVEAKTACRAVQFGVDDTRKLHEKDAFIRHTRHLGLLVPETHTVRSRHEMERTLHDAVGLGAENSKQQGRFIAKSIGMDDKSRADMTLLPRPTEADTKEHIGRLDISDKNPWILQEFIKGGEYCTHALVVRGSVKAFVACPSAELLMHYRALPPGSPLSMAMLEFTIRQAKSAGEDFTGHLSFDFLVKEEDIPKKDAGAIRLYPIECNPRAHTAVVLFNDSTDMVAQYLSLLDADELKDAATDEQDSFLPAADASHMPVTPCSPAKYYWVGHDLVVLFLLPPVRAMCGRASMNQVRKSWQEFIEHLVFWKDGTYEVWDPLPWWWLYHVFWPMQFVNSIRNGTRWSRVNVSTTKIFGCE